MKERELNNEREKERERKWGNRTGNQPSTFFSKWIKNFNNFFSTTTNNNNSCCGRIRVDQIKSKESQLASNKSEESSETLILVQKGKKEKKTEDRRPKNMAVMSRTFFVGANDEVFVASCYISLFILQKRIYGWTFFCPKLSSNQQPFNASFFLLQVFECLVMTKGQTFYHPSYQDFRIRD